MFSSRRSIVRTSIPRVSCSTLRTAGRERSKINGGEKGGEKEKKKTKRYFIQLTCYTFRRNASCLHPMCTHRDFILKEARQKARHHIQVRALSAQKRKGGDSREVAGGWKDRTHLPSSPPHAHQPCNITLNVCPCVFPEKGEGKGERGKGKGRGKERRKGEILLVHLFGTAK